MIKFEFTVDDQDAANIFNCIQSHIVETMSKAIDERMKGNIDNADWLNKHVLYLKGLMPQMLNTRVNPGQLDK